MGGGAGQKFVIIEAKGKYGSGIHMKIVVRGTKIDSEFAELEKITKWMKDRIANAPTYEIEGPTSYETTTKPSEQSTMLSV